MRRYLQGWATVAGELLPFLLRVRGGPGLKLLAGDRLASLTPIMSLKNPLHTLVSQFLTIHFQLNRPSTPCLRSLPSLQAFRPTFFMDFSTSVHSLLPNHLIPLYTAFFNPLKLSGNYMYRLLLQSVTLQGSTGRSVRFAWFRLNSDYFLEHR
jgi:hypothetical protein